MRRRARFAGNLHASRPSVAPLPDHLAPGLCVLFVGINPGLRSAQSGHHYAGRGNRFWKLLYDSGLVPEAIPAERDADLLRWGYGLTNIVARATSGVADLNARDFERGRRELIEKIRTLRPAIVATVGLTVFDRLQPQANRSAKRRVGVQRQRLHGARVVILPNPSGRNTHFTYGQMLAAYRRLAHLVRRLAKNDTRLEKNFG